MEKYLNFICRVENIFVRAVERNVNFSLFFLYISPLVWKIWNSKSIRTKIIPYYFKIEIQSRRQHFPYFLIFAFACLPARKISFRECCTWKWPIFPSTYCGRCEPKSSGVKILAIIQRGQTNRPASFALFMFSCWRRRSRFNLWRVSFSYSVFFFYNYLFI